MFRFENEIYLYGLLGLPLLLILFLVYRGWVNRARRQFAGTELYETISPARSTTRAWIRFILLFLSFSLLIVALANPQSGGKLTEVKIEGVDIMIALDVSNSMNAEDITPTRLERSKRAIAQLIDRLRNDRIGMIVFAGQAYVQLPITADFTAAKMFLNTISTDMVQSQGTDIAAAIDLSQQSFSQSKSKKKVLIIITDGESHEQDPISAAKEAADNGIIIHCIGMGSEGGAPIPDIINGIKSGFKKDREGNTVVTRLNEKILVDVSAAAGGIYVRATNSEAGLNTIYSKIEGMEKQKMGSKIYTDYESNYQPFLALAACFLLLEIIIPERKSKWVERLDLFGEKK